MTVKQVCMSIYREFLTAELSVLWLVPSAVRCTIPWQRVRAWAQSFMQRCSYEVVLQYVGPTLFLHPVL